MSFCSECNGDLFRKHELLEQCLIAVVGERRRPGAPAAITREQIVDVAEALAQREGLDAITVRRVASELGVTPAALYWHLADKQELVRALVDRASARTEFPDASFGNWLERLIRFYLSTREQFSAYPGLSSALVTAEPTEATLANCMFVLGLLNEAGFDATTALEVFDALSMLSIGHLTMIELARFRLAPGA